MGEELTKLSGQPSGKVDTGGNSGGRNTAGNPRPADSGTGRTAPGGSGNPGGGNKTGEIEGKKISGLSPVIDPIPTPETPKKNQKRKPNKKKKSEPDSFNADQISALILSASAIVGSRPGLEVFTLQPVEAAQLATPLANMIAKSEALSKMGEHADAISLITASLVIFAPRFMMYADQQKKKKLEATGGVKLVRKESKSEGSSGKPSGTGTAKPQNDVTAISSAIPATL